jgi:hypothetical protein
LPEQAPPGADTGEGYEPWSEKPAKRRRREEAAG